MLVTKIDLSDAPVWLLDCLNYAHYRSEVPGSWGYPAYFVGGSVRDSLLGLTPKDWDVATAALPEQIVETFSDILLLHDWAPGPVNVKMIDAAQAYPVVQVQGFEVASFRADVKGASRNENNMKVGASLLEDAMRRDISINSLYANRHGDVLDPTGNGLSDLSAKLIRLNGDPYQRLQEDPLRVLRCVRFAAKLGFSFHKDTKDALKSFQIFFR